MNANIVGASVFGLLLVGGAFFYASQKESPADIQPLFNANDIVGETQPTRQYVTTADTNADGTPDWQTSLATIATDSATNTESVRVVPETLTEEFAVSVLDLYINAHLYNYTEEETAQQEDLTRNILVERAKDPLYTVQDITVSGDIDTNALHAYGNRIAIIALSHDTPAGTRDVLEIVSDAIINKDENILNEITPTRDAYQHIVDDLLTAKVPLIYIDEHLDLINTINALAIDMTIMQQAFSDPLYAELRLKRYNDDVIGMKNAISNLYTNLDTDGVSWNANDAVLQFVTIEP